MSTNLSLHERFIQSEVIYNQKKDTNEFLEPVKMKLYGLLKQSKEGDCRMPMPPRIGRAHV